MLTEACPGVPLVKDRQEPLLETYEEEDVPDKQNCLRDKGEVD